MPPPGACLNIVEARHRRDGYGSVGNPDRFLSQDYQLLKKYCIDKGVRFLDETFPPDWSSIGQGILKPSDQARVEWLRPPKLSQKPFFVQDGISRFDFGQGILGDCWFLASIGALTFQKSIFAQVVPLEQNFDENYCGLFHFRFWRFGQWVDVVIDDKLPTINRRLIFVHSKNPNEFWPALMQKAYAKVCGSYTDMDAGTPAEAMMDFTGGVHVHIVLSDPTSNLWQLMVNAGKSNTLMVCGTAQGEEPVNSLLPSGLIRGHAYTVTGVKKVKSRGDIVNLVRLWNPWGKREWNGDWSDRSSLWQTVSPQDRDTCLLVADDGEFWMTMEDFCRCYSDLDICGLSPDFLDGSSPSSWQTCMHEGRWVAGTTAGGCMNNRDSFWTNPQYRVKIGGQHSPGDETNILVLLIQKPDKRNRHLVQKFHIGFSIFEVPQQSVAQRGKFPAVFFSSNAPTAQTKTYTNARDVTEFLTVKPGEYLIVPSTFEPNKASSFILAVHSKTEIHCCENSGDFVHEVIERPRQKKDEEVDKERKMLFSQHSDKYKEVDAEQLQMLLNEKILKGDLKSGGFSIDACRSMVALMDTSITGRLNSQEFVHLWDNIILYKDIFYLTDISRTGTLSLGELRNAFATSGLRVSDSMLNVLALRYGASSGHMTLESFISLFIRLKCMQKIFKQLSDGKTMTLQEFEWMSISMYT